MSERTGEEQSGAAPGTVPGTAGGTDGTDGVEVVDHPLGVDHGRYELREQGEVVGVASYAVVPAGGADGRERVVFFHTEVRPDHEGRGLAARLASTALDATVASGRSVVALCPYVKAYLRRHPEPYAGHVVEPTPTDLEAADRAAHAAG
ncbi:GNAT family N-acetyltransferase [Terrabacter aerolatus]|nr:GNAT family N-acetyltransferase [Terrabacter aerolatus]